jgi:hypothetical protein
MGGAEMVTGFVELPLLLTLLSGGNCFFSGCSVAFSAAARFRFAMFELLRSREKMLKKAQHVGFPQLFPRGMDTCSRKGKARNNFPPSKSELLSLISE